MIIYEKKIIYVNYKTKYNHTPDLLLEISVHATISQIMVVYHGPMFHFVEKKIVEELFVKQFN